MSINASKLLEDINMVGPALASVQSSALSLTTCAHDGGWMTSILERHEEAQREMMARVMGQVAAAQNTLTQALRDDGFAEIRESLVACGAAGIGLSLRAIDCESLLERNQQIAADLSDRAAICIRDFGTQTLDSLKTRDLAEWNQRISAEMQDALDVRLADVAGYMSSMCSAETERFHQRAFDDMRDLLGACSRDIANEMSAVLRMGDEALSAMSVCKWPELDLCVIPPWNRMGDMVAPQRLPVTARCRYQSAHARDALSQSTLSCPIRLPRRTTPRRQGRKALARTTLQASRGCIRPVFAWLLWTAGCITVAGGVALFAVWFIYAADGRPHVIISLYGSDLHWMITDAGMAIRWATSSRALTEWIFPASLFDPAVLLLFGTGQWLIGRSKSVAACRPTTATHVRTALEGTAPRDND